MESQPHDKDHSLYNNIYEITFTAVTVDIALNIGHHHNSWYHC